MRDREAGRRARRGKQPYKLAAWHRLRRKKLAADAACERQTHCRGARATEVHHRNGDKWDWAWSNLESTCKPCHSAHTAREQSFGRGDTRDTDPKPPPTPWTYA